MFFKKIISYPRLMFPRKFILNFVLEIKKHRIMNMVLWITQGIVAAVFLMAGMMKIAQPKEKLKEKIGDWVDPVQPIVIKTIGTLELLGALGLIFPLLLNYLTVLVPLAALGLSLTMIGALLLHLKRKEYKETSVNVILLLLTIFIAYGRMELLNL